jgi:hypothetical protein
MTVPWTADIEPPFPSRRQGALPRARAAQGDTPEVQACTNLEPDVAVGLDDRLRAPYSARRAVEGCEKPVACGVQLTASELRQLSSHEGVVPLEQLAPAAVTQFDRSFGGTDDVGEEDGGEHSLRLRRLPTTRLVDSPYEVLDLLQKGTRSRQSRGGGCGQGPRRTGTRDPLSYPTGGRYRVVAAPVQHQCRHVAWHPHHTTGPDPSTRYAMPTSPLLAYRTFPNSISNSLRVDRIARTTAAYARTADTFRRPTACTAQGVSRNTGAGEDS